MSVAVLTLALGIGANTAIFSVVCRAASGIAVLAAGTTGVDLETSPRMTLGRIRIGPKLRRLARPESELCGACGIFYGNPVLTNAGEPERIPGATVTANFFDTLGVRPVLGRSFVASENAPGNNPVVILSHGLWQRRFSPIRKSLMKSHSTATHTVMLVYLRASKIRNPMRRDQVGYGCRCLSTPHKPGGETIF